MVSYQDYDLKSIYFPALEVTMFTAMLGAAYIAQMNEWVDYSFDSSFISTHIL